MPSKPPTTVEGDAEPWLIALMADQNRQDLFKVIKGDNVPYVTLQAWARQTYETRGHPVTPLEQAEHDLYEKIKAKVSIFQLQRQLAFVEQLEEEQKNGKLRESNGNIISDLRYWDDKGVADHPTDEEAQRSKKATRGDLLTDSEDDAPSSKKRKLASKGVADDDDMPPPPSKRRHISRADNEPFKPQPLSQAQPKAAVEADAELDRNLQAIARIFGEDLSELSDTSSDAVGARLAQAEESRTQLGLTDDGKYPQALHGHQIRGYAQRLAARRLKDQADPPRPSAHHSDSDSYARQVAASNIKKARSKKGARKPALPDEDDEIDYYSDDRDAGLPSRRSQNALPHQIALDDEAKLNPDRGARARSVAVSIRPRGKKVVNALRRSATHNQRAEGQSLILRGAKAGRQSNQSDADDSDDELPERPTARPVQKRPNSRLQEAPSGSVTLSASKAGPASANEMPPPSRLPGVVLNQANRDPREGNTMTMRRIPIGLRTGQNTDDGDPPPLLLSRTPHGRTYEDYDEEHKPVMGADVILHKWVRRKRYRVIRISTRNNRGEEVVQEELCLSDAPDGCKSPQPRWQKFKLQGLHNGRVWSEDWNPKPDHQPKGAQYYTVPAGEVMIRPRLPDLELARKHGMEEGAGSEYVRGLGSLAGSQAGVGMGGGSVVVSMAPRSTIGRESRIFSVRSGQRELNHNSKHERSVMRTTRVNFMAGDRDAPERTLAQRLGLGTVKTASVQDGPMSAPSTSSVRRLSGQASRHQLTLTNVAFLEAQTGQPTHAAAVVRGKLRDVAPGDEGRTIWLGDETPRRPVSIAPSESLRDSPQTAIQTRAVASRTSSARNCSAGRLLPLALGFTVPRDPRDFDIDISEDDRFISRPQTQGEQKLEAQLKESKRGEADMEAELAKLSGMNVTGMEGVDNRHVQSQGWHLGQDSQQGSQACHGGSLGGQRLGCVARHPRDSANNSIPSTRRTGIGSRNGGSAYGGSQRGGRGEEGEGNFRHGDRGGRGGYGGRGGGSQAGGNTYDDSQRSRRGGGGGSLFGGSQRGAGGGGPGGGGQIRQPQDGLDPVEEYERMRKAAEKKYPFQDA